MGSLRQDRPPVIQTMDAPARTPNEHRRPRRVRGMLDEIRSHGGAWLQHPLRRALTAFDRELFEKAERSRNPLDQQLCFESQHLLRQGLRDFEVAFHDEIVAGFDALLQPPCQAPQQSATAASSGLELVPPEEQEQDTILDKLAARGESRNGTLLFELSYRFAALLGSPPVESAALPLGPHALTRALRRAVGALPQLSARHRAELLQAFDSGLMAELEPLYQTVNDRLIAGGILPQLRAFPHTRPAATPTPAAAPLLKPEESAPVRATAAPSAAASAGAQRSDSLAVLENLRDLLAQHRAHAGSASNNADQVATPEALQVALAALQQHLADVASHATREIRSAQRLREELLTQLNANNPPGAGPTQLSTEQGDTVDLVAMLFEQLGQEMQAQGPAKSVLGRLQLPLLRLAMSDRAFFNQQEHPARKLLDTVAETTHHWLDSEGQTDRALVAQLDHLVERVQHETPSAGLYTSLLADIEHQLGILTRKSQMAERRHVEAMQGRERLEQARRRAAELMTARFAQHMPRGLLRVLLERAWSDVLTLALLRHGEESQQFTAQLHITDQLLGQQPIHDSTRLQNDIEGGLQQIGMHAEEAAQVAQRLLRQTEPVAIDLEPTPIATTELALRIKQRPRLGESSAIPAEATAPSVPPAVPDALNGAEQAMFKHLLRLPFGTWFLFPDGERGNVRRKLAWYSTVSGRCLLTTRRGLRADEMTLQQLARELASGRVSEIVPSREGLLDRAWNRLTTNLRRRVPDGLTPNQEA